MQEITNFNYNDIKVYKISLLSYKQVNLDDDKEKIDTSSLFYEIGNFGNINIKQNLVDVLTVVRILKEDIQNENVNEVELCKIETSCIYKVNKLENYLNKIEDSIEVEKTLLSKLIENSLATTRGILFIKTSGSYLKDLYLPILDCDEISKSISKKELS